MSTRRGSSPPPSSLMLSVQERSRRRRLADLTGAPFACSARAPAGARRSSVNAAAAPRGRIGIFIVPPLARNRRPGWPSAKLILSARGRDHGGPGLVGDGRLAFHAVVGA